MRGFRLYLLQFCVLLACLCMTLPAFAHDEDEPPPPVNPKIARASTFLAAGAFVLVLVAGGYVLLVKRGIIKSKSGDRWE